MTEQELMADCGTDVSVTFPESLHIYPGLITAAAVCGVLSAIFVAVLLYVFCLKPLLLTRQGYNARRLLEPDDGEVDNNNHHVSSSRKEVPSATASDKEKKKQQQLQQQQQQPLNSDVAAFASRAKVVYPINQKYRPLADGASNPSLHEHSKLPAMPNDDSRSSSDAESLSQEQDNDGSSQFMSSSLVPKSLQNQSFIRVSHPPHTLTLTGFEGRISLYCLALQDVQQLCSQLQEEKFQIFLQAVKILFTCRFPKDKNDADFSKNILLMQQKKLDELRKQLPAGHVAGETDVDASCTLEEVERTQKDLLERGLQMSRCFSKLVEDLCQSLLKTTGIFPADEVQTAIESLSQTLLSTEKEQMEAQEAELKRVHGRLLWWEELTALLQSQPALLRWEVSLRQSLTATALEQLTGDDILTFGHMEKILSEVRGALSEGLQRSSEDYLKKTKELVTEKCSKMESKQKKLQRSQAKEKSRVLELRHGDLQQLTKMYRELLVKHRQQLSDLQLQHDNRLAESLGNLWTKLRCTWSKRLGALAKDIFLASVPGQSTLSELHGQRLWSEQEQELGVQLRQVENATKLQLEETMTQLDRDRQFWNEEMALVHVCLKQLREQQLKILRAMVVRQSYTLDSEAGMLMEKKHERVLVAVQRLFVARRFCLHTLKEMRLSKLKVLSQTDFRALLMADPGPDQSCVSSALKRSSASLAERHLGPESQLVGHSFHQEFLSELETGTELLQSHAQLVLGNALSHGIQLRMKAPPPGPQSKQGDDLKRHLTEAASESVYVTKDSLTSLVQSYYSRLCEVVSALHQDESNVNAGVSESSSQLDKSLLRELVNWGKKPTSVEFQQRVELHKRRLLEQCDAEQETRCQRLRRRKVDLDQTLERTNEQLMEAEESFIGELAALARVSLHSPEPSGEEDNAGDENASILDLLARNPALDPALNPSLTPTVVAPTVKATKQKRREDKSQLS